MDLVYFIILVSSLIFVHELGHFLFAKAFGVKVITFSLGFGPKILKLRGRETEYCVSLLPLGGYVKMLEESKSDIVLPEDRKRTFESLAVYKRIIIVLAGPLMNLIFPVLLYFAVFVTEGPFLPPTIGVVLPGHPADGKLLPGDRVLAVNGEEIGTFNELQRFVGNSPNELLRFKVFRDKKHVEVDVVAEETVARRELDIIEREGSIGVLSSAPAPVIGIPDPSSPAYRAGLRTFDVLQSIAGKEVDRFMDLEREIAENHGETVPVTYLRPVPVEAALGGLADMAVYEAGVVALTPHPEGKTLLERTGLELADLYATIVPEDSYLYKAQLRPGDKLLTLDGETLPAWSTFEERVKAAPDRPHRIEYLSARDGRIRAGTFQVYTLRVKNWVPVSPHLRVDHPTPVRYAFTKAVEETIDVTRFVMVAIVRLFQGRLSLENVSGPIAIYELAGEEGRKGADFFIWVMALLSINLGLLNLLPIPVLDGGHLVFFVAEATMRRPIPLRVREVAHLVGMLMLLGLMGLAFKNDVENRWDAIKAQVREIVGRSVT